MITTVQTPYTFSPAGNPIVFKFSSDDAAFIYFKIEVKDAVTDTVLHTGNYPPSPATLTQSLVNLSKSLSEVVKYKADNDIEEIVLDKPTSILGYKLTVTERGLVAGYATDLTSITTDTFYAFDGNLDLFNFTKAYTVDSYVLEAGNTAKFLTLQPARKKVNNFSTEQLYFLQTGLEALTATFTVAGVEHDFLFEGTEVPHYTYNPVILASKATARVAINATGVVGDNIGVYANGVLLGSYTINTTSPTTTFIASGLGLNLNANGLGYAIATDGNIITISAPSTGTAGNATVLTTALFNASTTVPFVTGTTNATVTITGYALPTPYSDTIVTVADPVYGVITLGIYTVSPGDSTLTVYTTQLVAELNSNSYGYVATKTGAGTFIITARTGLGASINGLGVSYENDILGDYTTFYFSGGTTSTSGTTTTYHTIVPNSVVDFDGGTNYTAASTTTTYTTEFGEMFRIQTSPKALLENGIIHSFVEGETYSVVIKDADGVETLTEPFVYSFSEPACHLKLVNVLFINSFGGIDTFQFIQPQETINVTRLDVTKNNLKEGSYITDDVYNVADEVYSSNAKSTVKVYTQQLSDAEAAWLTELVNSKQCWIELSDNTLMPVKLVNTSYSVQQNRYMKTELNQYSFEFSFPNNALPSTSAGVSITIN